MEEETTTTTAVTPQQIQDDIINGLAYLAKTTTPYSGMVTRYKTSDWTKWPQTSNWYKGLKLLHRAHDRALLCVYSNYGVSAYNK
jgi:hypothetical protein